MSELVRLRTQESTDSQFSSDLREFASTRHIVFPECESLANFDCSSRDVCINLTSSIFEPLLFEIASLQHSTDLETPSTVLKGMFDPLWVNELTTYRGNTAQKCTLSTENISELHINK